jgi:subtilisin family serine protease
MRSLVMTVALLLVLPASAQAADGDIIVQRAPGLDSAERLELRQDAGVKLVETLPLARTELVSSEDPDQALAALRADDDVIYAEPDRRMQASRVMDDPFFGSLWALQNTGQNIWGQIGTAGDDIDATLAWDQTEGAGVTVAVVDSGIKADHVDLVGQIAPGGWDFVDRDADPNDVFGHGTHVSGTIAASGENDEGVVGVAPRAKLLPLRALGSDGTGSSSTIAAALAYAGDQGVRIVNVSLGGGYSRTIENAIASHPNTLYVVAAGNSAADSDTSYNAFPCALPEDNLICVGASDNRDRIAGFSNYGDVAVDLFAPGVDINSTFIGWTSSYVYLDGTSMAAPHVSGAAALALSVHPDASTSYLRHALLASVDTKAQFAGKSVTGGRLNANSAVTAILAAEPVAEPTPEPPAPVPTPEAPAPVAPVATPTPVPTPDVVLSNLAISGALRTKASKLRVSFQLSRGTTVRYTVKAKGSKKAVGTWVKPGRAGTNTVLLRRALPTGRTLKRGTYTLSVAVSPTASASKIIKVR